MKPKQEIENIEKYTSDAPIKDEKNDRFQRYAFSKRIAETIAQRKTLDSIAIGIYGDWGEGKSSVLNFIESNLKTFPNTLVCKFNPWRFQDETQLLLGYFQLLASTLDKSIKSKGEKIGEVISEYADVVLPSFSLLEGIIGANPGEIVKKAANKYSTVDIAEQKSRIERILEEEHKRVVIFIDDIDRLDKKEIQAIFKLVKLTGDFAYTSYVLAFDEKMVSKAIGDQYESGGELAGRNFLEKIIQVPLTLPVAQRDALKRFCFEQVDNAIKSNNIELKEDEARSFVSIFTTNILPMLSTPRMAVRYGNSLSFSLPLLYKEVNLVDLMLIEAIKVFYPHLYDLIKSNSNYFLSSYSSVHAIPSDGSQNERKEKCSKAIDNVCKHYPEIDKYRIIELLESLFPIMNEVFHNYSHGEHNYTAWYIKKKIGSAHYFQRYFTYAVIEGQISDVIFDRFLLEVEKTAPSRNGKIFKEIIAETNAEALISKIRFNKEHFTVNLSKNLAIGIAKIGSEFPFRQNTFFGFDSPLGQAAYLLNTLLRNIPKNQERFSFAKKLLAMSKPFPLAYELMGWFRNEKDKETSEQIFNASQFDSLAEILLDRALTDSKKSSLYEKFPRYCSYLINSVWANVRDQKSLMEYVNALTHQKQSVISRVLKVHSPFIQGIGDEPFYGDLNKESYEVISKVYDTDILAAQVRVYFKIKTPPKKIINLENKQTELNRAKQFLYFKETAGNSH